MWLQPVRWNKIKQIEKEKRKKKNTLVENLSKQMDIRNKYQNVVIVNNQNSE